MPLIATFLCFTLLFSTAFVRVSIRDGCGTNAQVISEKTPTHDNNEIKFVTSSCPGFAALRNTTTTPSTAHRFVCDTTVTTSLPADCEALTDALEGLSGEIVSPPQTVTQVTNGTCFYDYTNFNTVQYDVCFPDFDGLAQCILANCFTRTTPATTA
ncbi:hypothetical protein M422DRAFT_256312 [Sphaerobolus stellatus SS14]|uniref:Uncharacterized protein n=1 Tax=Sphaerobolus stellatus (strain SS14) TaxID=990650 RepID=A0A0C9VRK9_SPHS4|nr:hypothetical protein M422DRAFT_256312 [Sphaerobolus stellatus SS14]